MSLSKNQLKLITSLQQKKYRLKNNLFIAEGTKVVNEFLNSIFELDQLFCVDNSNYLHIENVTKISEAELKKISTYKSPNNVVGLFKIPAVESIKSEGLILALDDINDPGNLGTIIRLCDWFGIDQLICSANTVDCYNSKVVQATMGSLARVSILYVDLEIYLNKMNLPKYATLLEGENVYKTSLPSNAILVMGNEANGISSEILKYLTNSISIPRFGENQQTESLNVATATAILLSEFKRGM
ncbi:MAG: RNA methyltransferase [Lutibacter sp.]|uniref:RNA methyltransferase n=1 Tax=Lutibacter sp. TaxID=1925666 RepID=UPI0017D19CDE|nr:RNA methyltransferase [Lutibacter sp.]MBT8316376.1 RNA methyltransferase [Lutibacter sp.]NNJ57236.1 RNA methyltransferase [Lutibacter sp.]